MPIYKYKHSCGYAGEFLLRHDSRDRVPTKCLRCGRSALAYIDRSQEMQQKDGVYGSFERQKP